MVPYISTTEAETYFAERVNTSAWDDADAEEQAKSLVQATRIIDRLNFAGEKNDEEQEVEFPRYDDTEIPDDIKFACAEIAIALLDGVDPEAEFDKLSMSSQGIANVRSTYDRSSVPEHIIAGVPSIVAWRFLKPYLLDARNINISRVS